MKPNKFLILIILAFTLLTHLIFLSSTPSGITNDELHFALNAKSVFLNFSSLANNWHPFSFTTIPGETSSELTFAVLSPIIGPLPLNLFNARLPLAIFSLFSVYLLYLISSQLFSRTIGLSVAFVAALNPWFFYVYRTTFDAPIAILFFLLTLYSLINLKNWKLLFSIIPITLAFYTYIGTKVIVFPFVFIISVFSYLYIFKKHFLKQFIILNLFTLGLSILFFINLSKSPIGQRTSELITPWSPTIVAIVEQQRSLTTPTILTPLFTNKFTVYFQFVTNKWLNSFSPNLLFIKGDDTFTGSLWRHGYFYYLDALFILLGLIYLYSSFRPTFYLILSLLIISPIPEIIRKDNIPAYVFHSALQYPLLVLISGVGLSLFLTFFKNKLFKAATILIYIICFINLLYIYFLQYPIYASESFSYSNRLLSNYLIPQSNQSQSKIFVFCQEPDAQFKSYIFYSNALNKSSFPTISTAYTNGYKINNLTFLRPNSTANINTNDIVVVQEGVNSPPSFTQNNKNIIYRLDNHQPAFNIYTRLP